MVLKDIYVLKRYKCFCNRMLIYYASFLSFHPRYMIIFM